MPTKRGIDPKIGDALVQHSKLSNAASAAKLKKFWGQKLDSLKTILTAKS